MMPCLDARSRGGSRSSRCGVSTWIASEALEFRPSGTLNILDLLDRGELDLAIGPFAEQGERFSRQQLLQDKFVVVLRKNHPAAGTRELSIEKFAALPHLEISSVHYAIDFIDEALARRKL